MSDSKYTGNPKHGDAGVPGSARGVRDTRNTLSPQESEALANDRNNCIVVPGKRQLVGVKNGTIYVFQHDNFAGYHAYPVSGKELCSRFPSVQGWVAEKLGTDHKRLSRSEDIPVKVS